MAGLHPDRLEQELDRVASSQLSLLCRQEWLRHSCFQGRAVSDAGWLCSSPSISPEQTGWCVTEQGCHFRGNQRGRVGSRKPGF